MSQSTPSSSFQSLFNSALQDYADQTGIKLNDHSLTKQLENCDSIDAISSILQEHARRFYEFRGEDGKIMKSLESVINVLYTLSTSTVLGEGIGIVCPKLLIFFFLFFVLNVYSTAISSGEDCVCCFCDLARRTSLPLFSYVYPCNV
jgi:hypothetical protein